MIVKDLAKAVEALANAETFLRQSKVERAIDLAVRVKLIGDEAATLRGTLTGGSK